jgi:hypothetical protein
MSGPLAPAKRTPASRTRVIDGRPAERGLGPGSPTLALVGRIGHVSDSWLGRLRKSVCTRNYVPQDQE